MDGGPSGSRWRAGPAVQAVTAAVLAAVTTVLLPASPAAAYPTANVEITGHGYGHGRGMSQYGAYGYATNYAWTYRQILSHFYGGTTLSTQANSVVTVRLTALDGAALAVTSRTAFTAGGRAFPANSAATITLRSDGKFTLATSPGCGKAATKTEVVASGAVTSTVGAPGNDLAKMLTLCATGRTYRGSLLVVSSGGAHVVNRVLMEDYLRGVVPRESPASWGDAAGGKGLQALAAQSVAARSYAHSENRASYAKTCDTTSCQVYGGAGLNGAMIEDPRTNKAIATTSGQVVRSGSGAIVRAEFSSSSGGWTAGGTFPAVQDLGDTVSPRHNWTVSVAATTVGSAFGVGTLQAVQVVSRNGLGADGGRVLTVRVSGSTRTVEVSGSQFRTTLGLYSDWFSTGGNREAPVFHLTNRLSGPTSTSLRMGNYGDLPVAGDFDGNGKDTIGVYRSGTFYLRNTLVGGTPLVTIRFGNPGDRPLAGDWDGNGTDTIGVYRPSSATFYLRNSNSAGAAQIVVSRGVVGDRPLAGDWDGNGKDTIGLYRPGSATFYLMAGTAPTSATSGYAYGDGGDVPVVGDWNGDRKTTIGVRRGKVFHVANRNGGPTAASFMFGYDADIPLAGDWDGNGTSTAAVGRDLA